MAGTLGATERPGTAGLKGPVTWILLLSFVLAAGPARAEQYYEVRPGDTLRKIAHDKLGDANLWPAIYRSNAHLQDGGPDRIPVGTLIVIPDDDMMRNEFGITPQRSPLVRFLDRVSPLGIPLLLALFIHVLFQGCLLWMGGTLCRIPQSTFPNSLRATAFTDLILLVFAFAGSFLGLNIAKQNPETAASIPTIDGLSDTLRHWLVNPSAPLPVLAGAPLLYSIVGYLMVRRVFATTPGRAGAVTGISMFLPLMAFILLSSGGSLRVT